MPRWRQLALWMACATSLAWGPAASAGVPAPAARQQQALQAFERDLVSVLALRGDARGLMGAALLARPLPRPQKLNDFHSLILRATQAPGAGAAPWWLRLADCDSHAGDCPERDALDALQEQAADNAAVWLVRLGVDLGDNHAQAARADLAHAAAATFYDDYAGASLQALAMDVAALPPPEATYAADAGGGADGVRAMIVFGLGGAQPQPALQGAAGLCVDPGKDAALRADCLALARTLEWGSSPLARSLGLHLRETLAAEPAARTEARRARQDLVWQLQAFNRLVAQTQTDPALARRLLGLVRQGGTEMSLMLAALRQAGLPTEAPAEEASSAGPD